jgi:hypothetical protein
MRFPAGLRCIDHKNKGIEPDTQILYTTERLQLDAGRGVGGGHACLGDEREGDV